MHRSRGIRCLLVGPAEFDPPAADSYILKSDAKAIFRDRDDGEDDREPRAVTSRLVLNRCE
jgi:hypothetical protein